jgi:hypothetical protein
MYYSPNRYCAPGTYYRPTRPNYVVSGTVLGAASGALIGAGNHNAGEGALIGAGAGLLLGSAAEYSAHREARRVSAAQNISQSYIPSVPATPNNPPPQAAESRSKITSQPSARSTYYWTTRPQISDAPRVPNAPTF